MYLLSFVCIMKIKSGKIFAQTISQRTCLVTMNVKRTTKRWEIETFCYLFFKKINKIDTAFLTGKFL